MGDVIGGLIAVLGSIVGSVLLLFIVRRYVHIDHSFEKHNDVTGICVTMIGTLIAVILAFMVYAVWDRFENAKATSEHEGVELIATYRMSGAMEPKKRDAMRLMLTEYAEAVRSEEWPAMAHGKVGKKARALIEQIYGEVLSVEPKTNSQYILIDHMLYTVTDISTDRSTRLVLSQSELPEGLWIVMIVGCIVTVLAFCLQWVERPVVHYLLVGMMSGMVALVLFTIKLLDHPFQGSLCVKPSGISHSIDYFKAHAHDTLGTFAPDDDDTSIASLGRGRAALGSLALDK